MGATWNETPSANRLHIGVFGKTNSGKSSFINAFTGQEVSIVADVAGTTTDPVYKAMEIYPMGRARLWTRRDSMMKVRWENSAWNGRGLQPKKLIWQLLFFLHVRFAANPMRKN